MFRSRVPRGHAACATELRKRTHVTHCHNRRTGCMAAVANALNGRLIGGFRQRRLFCILNANTKVQLIGVSVTGYMT